LSFLFEDTFQRLAADELPHRAFVSFTSSDTRLHVRSQNCGLWALRYTFAISRLKTGWVAAWLFGGNQAARFSLILGLQAFTMPGATLLGIQHPLRTPGKGETCLAFAGFQLRRNSRKSRSSHGNEESPVTRSRD
jgi:hypothetical protein